MHDGFDCFVAAVVFKSTSLQKVGQSSQFQREMSSWGRRRRELQLPQESFSFRVILPDVGEGLGL